MCARWRDYCVDYPLQLSYQLLYKFNDFKININLKLLVLYYIFVGLIFLVSAQSYDVILYFIITQNKYVTRDYS